MAEGAPLLREYGLIAHRGFESLPHRHKQNNRLQAVFLFMVVRDVWTNPPVRRQENAPAFPALPPSLAVASPKGDRQGAKRRSNPLVELYTMSIMFRKDPAYGRVFCVWLLEMCERTLRFDGRKLLLHFLHSCHPWRSRA